MQNVFIDVNPKHLTLRLHPMKNAIAIFLLCSALSGQAQTFPTVQADGLVAYTGTVEIPNATQGELMERAKSWLMGSSHSISFVSDEMGLISLGSTIPYMASNREIRASVNGRVVYIATFLVQDGILAYEFNNFFHEADPSLQRATDLGFVIADGATSKDLNRDWKMLAMNDLRGKLDTALQKMIGDLKKTLADQNPSFSLNPKEDKTR